MAENKKYLSILSTGKEDLHIKDSEARERIQELEELSVDYETDPAIDTLFDTEVDESDNKIIFGQDCASYNSQDGSLHIEGQVVGTTCIIS